MYDWEIRQYVANKKVLTVDDFYGTIFNTSPQITEIKVARNTPFGCVYAVKTDCGMYLEIEIIRG